MFSDLSVSLSPFILFIQGFISRVGLGGHRECVCSVCLCTVCSVCLSSVCAVIVCAVFVCAVCVLSFSRVGLKTESVTLPMSTKGFPVSAVNQLLTQR